MYIMSSMEKIISQVKDRVARLNQMHSDVADKVSQTNKALHDEAEWKGMITASMALRKRLEAEKTELQKRISDHEEVDNFLIDHFEATRLETETVTGAFGVQKEVKTPVKQ